MTRHRHHLPGCHPEPLGAYLKALGVLRLLAEQADASVTAWWSGHGFVVDTRLDDEELTAFLLHGYRPSPLVSPWNKSSGFGPEGKDELQAIEASDDERLREYQIAIAAGRHVLAGGGSKDTVLAASRARLPDLSVAWMDAAAVLVDGRAVFPPLLGTGGNDGRLEFSRNFHRGVLDVLGMTRRGRAERADWLADALFDLGVSAGVKRTPGQFSPGAAGGSNSAPAGAADAVLNPWDWVLLLEGSLLLASGSARRLATSTTGRAAAPFTVDAYAGGYPSAADAEKSRGEFWAPLWSRPTGYQEVRRLFGEARADWRGRHVRSGLDLAKAAASLGTDRGIDAFSRHGFMERFGLATVAVPVGRVVVAEHRAAPPLAELDGWLARVRSASNAPSAVAAALRAVDRAAFAVTRLGGSAQGERETVLQVLLAAARLEAAIGRSGSFRERSGVGPVSGLRAASWLPLLTGDDADVEVNLALGLASLREGTEPVGTVRRILGPIGLDPRGRAAWSGRPAGVQGLGRRPTTAVLADALARRAVDVVRAARGQADEREQVGLPPLFGTGRRTHVADVADLVAGRVDDDRLGEALAACMLLDWSGREPETGGSRAWAQVPPVAGVVVPFFTAPSRVEVPSDRRNARPRTTPLVAETRWPALLASGRLQPVVEGALHRLRLAGLEPVPFAASLVAGQPPGLAARVAAASLCRLGDGDRAGLVSLACPEPLIIEPKESHHAEP